MNPNPLPVPSVAVRILIAAAVGVTLLLLLAGVVYALYRIARGAGSVWRESRAMKVVVLLVGVATAAVVGGLVHVARLRIARPNQEWAEVTVVSVSPDLETRTRLSPGVGLESKGSVEWAHHSRGGGWNASGLGPSANWFTSLLPEGLACTSGYGRSTRHFPVGALKVRIGETYRVMPGESLVIAEWDGNDPDDGPEHGSITYRATRQPGGH